MLKHIPTKKIKILDHVNMRGMSRNHVWEIDASCLRYEKQIASGSVSDLWVLSFHNSYSCYLCESIHVELQQLDWHRYKGTYINQHVAIKVFKNGNLNENTQREFSQEVYILRLVLSSQNPFIIQYKCLYCCIFLIESSLQ